jgi:hypothetical protein
LQVDWAQSDWVLIAMCLSRLKRIPSPAVAAQNDSRCSRCLTDWPASQDERCHPPEHWLVNLPHPVAEHSLQQKEDVERFVHHHSEQRHLDWHSPDSSQAEAHWERGSCPEHCLHSEPDSVLEHCSRSEPLADLYSAVVEASWRESAASSEHPVDVQDFSPVLPAWLQTE